MNAIQVQTCVENALRCQATGSLHLVPLVTSAIRVPRQSLAARTRQQTRQLHQHTTLRPASTSPLSHRRLPSSFSPKHSPPLNNVAKTRSYATSQPTSSPKPAIHPVFEPRTGTFQYLVADPSTNKAVIIDPVLDYDKCSQTITTTSADALLSLVREKGYAIVRILETHAHADHLTASFYLQRRLAEQQEGVKVPVCIGKRIGKVQSLFGERYGIDAEEYEGVFDRLLDDDEEFEIGGLKAKAIHLPGHTPDHMGYRIGGKSFLLRVYGDRDGC